MLEGGSALNTVGSVSGDASASAQAAHRLSAVDIVVKFGGVVALNGVSLQLASGAIVGLIGPNGSGKTTLLNVISGVVQANSGRVILNGADILGADQAAIARRGVLRSFQNIRLFTSLTACQNGQTTLLACGTAEGGASRNEAVRLLRVVGLEEAADIRASTLSYGSQRRLELARALAGRPKFLLLDEPAAGMNEAESLALGGTLRRIPDDWGCGVLLVEHDFKLVMDTCVRIYALSEGVLIAEGGPEQVAADKAVRQAYLGVD